jgi:DNA-binding GntR family transcriptional regulator
MGNPISLEGVFWSPLKRTGRVALYRQIADRLRLEILRGESRLPSERELAVGFTVARVTVRAALDLLVADQLISRRRRHGTVVRDDFDRAAVAREIDAVSRAPFADWL